MIVKTLDSISELISNTEFPILMCQKFENILGGEVLAWRHKSDLWQILKSIVLLLVSDAPSRQLPLSDDNDCNIAQLQQSDLGTCTNTVHRQDF